MRIRTMTAATAAILTVTIVGCGSGKSGESKADTANSTVAAGPNASDGTGAEKAGIPPEPTGAERDAVLAAIRDVNAHLTRDEDKALDAARNQCSSLDGGATNPDRTAAQRFSYDGVTLTDDDGSHLNTGLRRTLCPES
ncbi:hypothetical protein [Streptomyces sp. ALB3]|uniref:hypothetical protein n=1 Tax=Streptomyces sp. ALB3 TaxID=3374278 RepID=UPI003799E94B